MTVATLVDSSEQMTTKSFKNEIGHVWNTLMNDPETNKYGNVDAESVTIHDVEAYVHNCLQLDDSNKDVGHCVQSMSFEMANETSMLGNEL